MQNHNCMEINIKKKKKKTSCQKSAKIKVENIRQYERNTQGKKKTWIRSIPLVIKTYNNNNINIIYIYISIFKGKDNK